MTTDRKSIPDELAIRITDYLDGEMTDGERQEFESELKSDEVLRGELRALQSTMAVCSDLQIRFAPDDFVDHVESSVRTRSRGRFFAYNALYTSRIPYEVFAVVAIAVMSAMWMMATPDDARFSADLAIASQKEAGESKGAGTMADADSEQSAGAGIVGEPAKVRALKAEVIEYRVVLSARPGQSRDVESLAKRLRATSRKYVVKVVGDEVEVMVPAAQTDRFLQDWSGPGATLTRQRKMIDGPQPALDRVRIQYAPR